MRLYRILFIALTALLPLRAATPNSLPEIAVAQPSPSAWDDISFRIDNTIASRYWGSIVGGIFYPGGAVNFTDFTVTKEDSLGSMYFLIGMINPLDTFEYDDQGGTEYYLGLGHSFDLWKDGNGPPLVGLDVFVLYDAISPIEEMDDDVIETRLRLDFPRVPFAQPYIEYYNWQASGNDAPPVGSFIRVGTQRQQPLGISFQQSELKLKIDASLGFAGEGLFGTDGGLSYYRLVLSLPVKISEHFSVTPAIIGQLPGNQDPDAAFVDRPRLFYNLTLSWEF
ncbi:hypothetical protein H7X65_00275 [Candidatus Parcubacteria bacterium]|nr:hypothetical protein [Candidatus Parcubacteria bacterium]